MTKQRKGKRVQLRRGDLFEFQVSDGRLGYGQVVEPGGVFYAIFFESLHCSRPDVADIISDKIALVGATMDSLIYHGSWTVFARDVPVPEAIPFPNWKVTIDGELRTTDFHGHEHWPMRSDEMDLLDFKFSRSPIGYQEALEALNGLREWQESDHKLMVAHAERRVTRKVGSDVG